ncbi:hypothetical protein HK102_008159 [Quaeritorhiza haematococci]|nr:hypothetical protein HK102_008159 [Quaeritorhiza haematococci]
MRTGILLAIAPFIVALLGSQPSAVEASPGYYDDKKYDGKYYDSKYNFEKTYEQCLKICHANKDKKYQKRCFYQCEALEKAAHHNKYWDGKYGQYDGKYYSHGFEGKYDGYYHDEKYDGKYSDGKYYDGKYDGKYYDNKYYYGKY